MKTGPSQTQIDWLPELQSFLERVTDRPWVAIIELLLIGVVVYTVLRFFQGTRGARLVRAVLAILAVSFAIVWLIAEKLDSERIKVLYPYFILGVFLVSLVAFQSELRRFLLRLGEGGWFQRWTRGPTPLADHIVTAVERLSKKKIGALIALDRTGEVGALTESGVHLDAAVSTELLETIFWPGTPLHDLGVVIHRGRIVAAGCQFPLAESGEVDRALGSRHRAAIGMSQEAGALVIVVSEETGTISVAIRGRLRRALTADALRETVAKEMTAKPTKAAAAKSKASPAPAAGKVGYDGTGQAA